MFCSMAEAKQDSLAFGIHYTSDSDAIVFVKLFYFSPRGAISKIADLSCKEARNQLIAANEQPRRSALPRVTHCWHAYLQIANSELECKGTLRKKRRRRRVRSVSFVTATLVSTTNGSRSLRWEVFREKAHIME